MYRGRFLLVLAVIGGLAALHPARLAAQDSRVSVAVELGPPAPGERTGPRPPLVYVRELLRDPRWVQALEDVFAIQLQFRLEVWRSRSGWIDEFQQRATWTMVLQREPLQEAYRWTLLAEGGNKERRFDTRPELERYISYAQVIEDVAPRRNGTYYYTVRLKISPLSDQDLDELERFLAGDANPEPGERGGNPLGRGIYRFLLRLGGLPGEDLEARSEQFTVRR